MNSAGPGAPATGATSPVALRVVIADDEPAARRGVALMLRRHSEVSIVAECGDGLSAAKAISELAPNLVFLDIKMPGLDGFGVIDRVGVASFPRIVFVTAYDEFALRAFEVHAADYLLKPFTEARFEATLAHAQRTLAQDSLASAHLARTVLRELREPPSASAGHFAARLGPRTSIIPMDRVDWIEADDYYVILHVGNESHILRESIRSLAARLDGQRFARIHRSAIVNLSRVQHIDRRDGTHWTLRLLDGTELPISRRRHDQLDALLKSGRDRRGRG